MSSSDEEFNCTPKELKEEANFARSSLFPEKSKEKYIKVYENFMKWREEKKANSFSENIFLAYFNELAKSKMPSTLWATYSMIKFTVNIKHKINIKSFCNLTAFLKRQSGFKSKKSKVFTSEHIRKFLSEAPDEIFLATKVALILGVNGGCRTVELYNLTSKDVTYHDDVILVKLRDTKTKVDRLFVLRDEYIPIIKKYEALRPISTKCDKFLLHYKNGKCYNQVIGKHKMGSFPKEIAKYLNLPNSENYTGHCFRRTSATLLADSGANLITLKRHGGWKSDKVAEGYIEESITNKTHITDMINESIQYNKNKNERFISPQELKPQPSTSGHLSPRPSTSRTSYTVPSPPPSHHVISVSNTQTEVQQNNISVPGVNLTFNNCTLSNVTFHTK